MCYPSLRWRAMCRGIRRLAWSDSNWGSSRRSAVIRRRRIRYLMNARCLIITHGIEHQLTQRVAKRRVEAARGARRGELSRGGGGRLCSLLFLLQAMGREVRLRIGRRWSLRPIGKLISRVDRSYWAKVLAERQSPVL